MLLYVCATSPEFKEKHSAMTVSIAMVMKSFNSTLYRLDSAPARFFYYISNILNNISSRDDRGEKKKRKKKHYEGGSALRTEGLVSCKGSTQAPTATHSHRFHQHSSSGLGQGTVGTRAPNGDKGHQPGQGTPAGTRPQQQTANAPKTQWKNPKSLHNRTDASTSAVTAPLLHDSESKGWRKPVSNLDGSDPRAIYVTGVPEKSPRFLSGATLPRSSENFLLGPLPWVILISQGAKLTPSPSPSLLFTDMLLEIREPSKAWPKRRQPGLVVKSICVIFLTGVKCTDLLTSKQREVNY